MVVADPDATLPLETEIVEVVAETGPGVTVTVGAAVDTGVPPIVPTTLVAVPATTPVMVAE